MDSKNQNISYELIYRKDNENILIHVLIRRKDEFALENRKIFLTEIFLKEVKKRNFYFKINIVKVKQEQKTWYYKERRVLINQEDKTDVIKKKYDDSGSRHSGFKETLKKVNQTYYWD